MVQVDDHSYKGLNAPINPRADQDLSQWEIEEENKLNSKCSLMDYYDCFPQTKYRIWSVLKTFYGNGNVKGESGFSNIC